MRLPVVPFVLVVAVALTNSPAAAQRSRSQRLNPIIALLEQQKPVFGLYAPSARGTQPRNAPAESAAPAPAPKPPIELAKEALAYPSADFLFNGSMERGVDRGLPAFAEFLTAMGEAAGPNKPPFFGLTHPFTVKTPKISTDPAKAVENISRQLNAGAAGIVFVEVESATELRQGLAAMRFKSNGGTRPDDVGNAPAHWGMSAEEYRKKADLWPLNPDGELINWSIVESKEGLAHLDEIAAEKGVGVLFPGAGTLRGVFTSTGADGQRVFDEKGWEGAIQQLLGACKKYHVPCGYPATANDIEMRMTQGFSVFIINWGDAGFKAVDIGRGRSGRTDKK